MNKLEINIGLFGCVSVGKSSFLNAIVGQQYSDTEIKRTTMVPQVYVEADAEIDAWDSSKLAGAAVIRNRNREMNESVLKLLDLNKFTLNQCQPIYHQIDRICDLFDPDIIDSSLKINLYDIPGLNDSISKNIYCEWLKQNIKLFDIIIFMTDITRGLNDSDEIDILHLLIESMTRSKARMICLMNKCDDIHFDAGEDDLVFEEKEQENIYLQANNTLADIAKVYGFQQCNERITAFIPISSENCFIYRALIKVYYNLVPLQELDQSHLNRICKNECGLNQWKKMTQEGKEEMVKNVIKDLEHTYQNKILDTGYLSVKSVIQKTIADNKIDFLTSHLENDIHHLCLPTIEDVNLYIDLVNQYYHKLSQIESLQKKAENSRSVSYKILWDNVKKTINNYVKNVVKINTKIIRYRDFIEFKEFDRLNSTMQGHCISFKSLTEVLSQIPEYPKEFMEKHQEKISEKLLNIYEQLTQIEYTDQVHIRPDNLLSYLQIINTYSPLEFDSYALKFLELNYHTKYKYPILYEENLHRLIIYIISNLKKHLVNTYSQVLKSLFILLNNKIIFMSEEPIDKYFYYLLSLKKMVKKANINSANNYTLLDILSEVISKQISLVLGTNSVSNIYKQDVDHHKINTLLTRFWPSMEALSLKLEEDIIELLK